MSSLAPLVQVRSGLARPYRLVAKRFSSFFGVYGECLTKTWFIVMSARDRAEARRARAELLGGAGGSSVSPVHDGDDVEVVEYVDKKATRRGGGRKGRNVSSTATPSVVEEDLTPQKDVRELALETDEMEREALRMARDSTARTKQALSRATETREVGVNTAKALHEQTVQMENINSDLVHAYDVLDQSEKVIDQMHRPFMHRIIPRRTKDARKAKLRGTTRTATSVIDVPDDYDPATDEATERNELLGTAKATARELSPMTVSQELDMLDKEQDKNLDKIGGVVADLKNLAIGMNKELDVQTVLLDDIDSDTDQVRERIRRNNDKTRALVNKPKQRDEGVKVPTGKAGAVMALLK